MGHRHGQSHLVRRQRGRTQHEEEEDDPNIEVITSYAIATAKNTLTGDVVWVTKPVQTLGAPAVRSRPSSTEEDDAPQTSQPATATKKQSSDHALQTAQSSPVKQASSLMVATDSPTPKANLASAGIASATAAISSAAAATDAAAEGMTTGAKAGLALGALVVFGALLTGILLLYRRKKNRMAANMENEKIDLYDALAPPPPQVQAAPLPAPSIRTQRTMSTAPRLSLRPVTQFDPAFNENHKSGGNLLSVSAAAVHLAQPQDQDPERPGSAWERRGAANASASNPFNDPQTHSRDGSANPFANSAAVDAHQVSIPDSPPNASPMYSSQPSADFSKPVPAVPAAEINDPVAMAGAMASFPEPGHNLPVPPTINAATGGVPTSPAWTEDIPASPGPAPTGPPPVAGAMIGSRSNSPAPGPNNVHRVQLDFKPSMQDELDLHAGHLVRMLHEYDDGWALCIRMDRTQQGVVPRSCLSKNPVKPRTGPPRQGPPPGMRGPPIHSSMGPGGIPQPRPLSHQSRSNSPYPPSMSTANGRMSPAPRSMSPGPRQMSPPQQQGSPRIQMNPKGPPRGRANSNAPYAQPQRSMSPGPYGGGPQMAPPPQMGRPRANSASGVGGNARRGPPMGSSPMNPNGGSVPARKPVPGMAI